MNPERWRQVEEIYHSALERTPEARTRFVLALPMTHSSPENQA